MIRDSGVSPSRPHDETIWTRSAYIYYFWYSSRSASILTQKKWSHVLVNGICYSCESLTLLDSTLGWATFTRGADIVTARWLHYMISKITRVSIDNPTRRDTRTNSYQPNGVDQRMIVIKYFLYLFMYIISLYFLLNYFFQTSIQ